MNNGEELKNDQFGEEKIYEGFLKGYVYVLGIVWGGSYIVFVNIYLMGCYVLGRKI